LLDRPSSPPAAPHFPHATVRAALALDTQLRGVLAFQPDSSRYKGALVYRLRTEIGLHPASDNPATPFDLANLPSCLWHDIFHHGLAAVVPTPKASTLSGRDAPRFALASLTSIYADESKGAKNTAPVPAAYPCDPKRPTGPTGPPKPGPATRAFTSTQTRTYTARSLPVGPRSGWSLKALQRIRGVLLRGIV
jgi:hypothetical protein